MRKYIIAAVLAALAVIGIQLPAHAANFGSDGWWNTATFSGVGPPEEKWTYPDYPIRCNDVGTDPAWKVLWVHDGTNTLPNILPAVREGIARGMSIFGASAEDKFSSPSGAAHAPRLVTFQNSSGVCFASITPENVESKSLLTDYYGLATELTRRGYNDPNRKYLVLVDEDNPGIAGMSNLSGDSRLAYDNNNNQGANFSMVYGESAFWEERGATIAHEMSHNMGGVSSDAPHGREGHTFEAYDLMNTGRLDTTGTILNCANERYQVRADCSHDDYFGKQAQFASGARPAGYLATHWAVNDSRFMWTSYSTKPKP